MPQQPRTNVPDGWEVVDDTATTQPAGGVPDGWEVVTDAPAKPSNLMGGISAASAAGAAAVPALRRVAEQVATSPTLGRTAGMLARRIAPLNIGKQLYDVATGKQDVAGAAKDAALGEGARRLLSPAAKLLQRGAGPVAGMSIPLVAGGLAGVAGTAGFLGALQHDVNRDVTIDYTKNSPDTAVAKVFSNMRDSEKNRGRSLDERMDDPNDVMFRPDDTEDVRAAIVAALGGPQR